MEYIKSTRHIFLSVLAVLISTGAAMAQTAQAAPVQPKPSVYTSPVFYALASVALILLIFIVQLGKVLSALGKNYSRGDKSVWDKMKMVVVLVAMTFFTGSDMLAQAAPNAPAPAPASTPVLDFLHQGFGMNAMNALAVIILFELFVVFYLVRMIKLFVVKEKELAPLKEQEVVTSVFWDKFNKSVSIEQEAAVLTDHNYDGIRELDNALPPWWKYGFYFTIVWAFAYLVYYHVSNGPSSSQEYKAQMEEGAAQIADYRARAKNLVDETNVVLLTDASEISAGKATFTQYCAVCHAPDGGGIVGPNLTDKFWLHGGGIKEIFTTVKYGVQGKGMKSWQQELTPVMMAQVASFVKSLQGTTPVTPKVAEGTEWIDAAATTNTAANDTLVVKTDTLKVAAK